MIPGIFARAYSPRPVEALFATIRADGFLSVQLNLSCLGLAPLPAELPAGIPATVRRAAQAAGLDLCALSGTYNMIHPDRDRRQADRVGFANVVRAAADMAIPLVSLCTGTRNPDNMWHHHPDNATEAAWSDLLAELDFALGLAESFGVALAIEPEPGNVIADAPHARRLLDEVGSPSLGIVLDPANILPPEALPRQPAVIAEAARLLAPDLKLVHIKDVDAAGRFVSPGQGAVDFRAFVAAVRRIGYDGPLIAHGFGEAEAPGVLRMLQDLIDGAPE
ncbi:sugar phosphate isomerase/epimerase family protein [Aquisphaera insulae]|uniref:sugar phosphate isomerase/epimerase family protein n=1 Tax=Aquisphaera insulae TaxID=2712864 RepID=UPI0013EC3E6D|nr:sugar phosphate isomerase/epimerase [Aquisphaera insulae]